MIMKKTLLLLVVLLATVVTVNAQTIKERLQEEPQTTQEKLADALGVTPQAVRKTCGRDGANYPRATVPQPEVCGSAEQTERPVE